MFALEKKPERSKGATVNSIITYTLPKLHKAKKNWYVDFLAIDPATGGLKRKKYMLDRFQKVSEKKERAAEIITNVTVRLRKGWTPWAEVNDRRGYAQVRNVLELYRNHIVKLHAAGSMKRKTFYDYSSRMSSLQDFIDSQPIPIYIYISSTRHCYPIS